MLTIIQAGVTYLRARFSREDGAVTTEYGLLIVFIALAVIAGMIILANALLDMFGDAGASLDERPS
jgi:Flp pilus assembly pilin Flp